MNRFSFAFRTLVVLVGILLTACTSDYALRRMPESMDVTKYRDCTTVVPSRTSFRDHIFETTIFYDRCLATEYNAYLMIEHNYESMDVEETELDYHTENGDVIVTDAWIYSLEFWYNPVDIELEVIPYSGNTALGIHEFQIVCEDDASEVCGVTHTGSVSAEDFN